MQWIKRGKIFDYNTFNIEWFRKNAMRPLPYLLDGGVLRVFTTFCDENNVGRVGYADLNCENPKEILGFSRDPVLDIGKPGEFDDNGVTTGCLVEEADKLYLFYSGFQLAKKIPYMIFTGVAVSEDRGVHFQKLNEGTPVLDRIPTEINFRCVPYVIKRGTTYKMWYLADYMKNQSTWVHNENGKMQPVYSGRYLESDDLLEWNGVGKTTFDSMTEDEHGLCIDSVWVEDGIYKCIYSVRSLSNGYRLGYAESIDGKKFLRMDKELNLDVSSDGFDSRMMCYAKLIAVKGKKYLFYSGNDYGTEGIGYAELIG